MEMKMSYYQVPTAIGPGTHWWDAPQHRHLQREKPASLAVSMAPLLRQMLAVHEASHTVWHWANRRSVHSVEVHDDGGEFRAVEGAGDHTPLYASNDVTDMLRDSDRKTREGWLHEATAFMVSRTAQRKFGARDPAHNEWCANDLNMVRRIVDALGGSAQARAENLQRIEAKAELFVSCYWKRIIRLANAILQHGGRLNESQIRAVLSRASVVKLNESAASFAAELAKNGRLNWGPFVPDLDGELTEGEPGSEYFLGVEDADDTTTTTVHFPFGRDNEVYLVALEQAAAQGGIVGDFASQLLVNIKAEKAQAKADTPNPRGWGYALPRRAGDEPDFRRRVDGYFR
jgi:hypothetical protein